MAGFSDNAGVSLLIIAVPIVTGDNYIAMFGVFTVHMPLTLAFTYAY